MAFNWFQMIPQIGAENAHVATAAATGVVLIGASMVARASLGKGATSTEPVGKFSVRAIFEEVTEFIAGLSQMVIGEEGKRFIPLFTTLFVFLAFNNLVGLIPGMTPATENINTAVAVGIFSFIAYNFFGLKEHGIAYLKQFLGPLLALAPLMIIIELISHIVRPLSLGLRLHGNMLGDHTVLGIFLEILPVEFRFIPVAAIFYGLGTFVSLMQAFVFTTLSMIYVSLAISHDH
jgi:F-type H+-transporting ATPase subunit a